MAIKDVTPNMTSNSTPSPFVVTANSEYSEGYKAFRALDYGDTNSYWCTVYGVPKGELTIGRTDDIKFKVSKIILPNQIKTYGFSKVTVLVGDSLEQLKQVCEINKLNEFVTEIDLIKTYTFSYIKIVCENLTTSNSGFGIYDLKLLYDDTYPEDNQDKVENVSHTRAFHAQTLPMNTTQKILAKTNDNREGLLGMANDKDNYGDLYVVGKDGRSHLTKSGVKSEVIFEGNANTLNTVYKTSKNIYDYKYIAIIGDTGDDATYNCMISIVINTEHLKSMTTKRDVLINANNRYIAVAFSDDGLSFTVSSLLNVLGTKCSVNRIDGIY